MFVSAHVADNHLVTRFQPRYDFHIFKITITQLNLTLFTSSCIRMPIDLDLWSSLYPQLGGSYTFRLRENSSMDFHLPYIVENESDARIADRDYMLDRPWYLNISLYPVKKRIEIVLCEQ